MKKHSKSIVLMFHQVHEATVQDSFSVTRDYFRRVLDAVSELRSNLPNVVLTFDDGNASDYEVVLNELLCRGLNAHFFVSPDLLGAKGYMTWGQVLDLSKEGMQIGSHTLSHCNLALVPCSQARRELIGSRERLEDFLQKETIELALPGGFAPKGLVSLAAEAGYSRVYTSRPGFWDGHSLFVPRICVRQSQQLLSLSRLMSGHVTAYMILEKQKSFARRFLGPHLYGHLRTVLAWARTH